MEELLEEAIRIAADLNQRFWVETMNDEIQPITIDHNGCDFAILFMNWPVWDSDTDDRPEINDEVKLGLTQYVREQVKQLATELQIGLG